MATSTIRPLSTAAMTSVHKIAQAGFAEKTSTLYDNYRPTYPEEQLSYIQSSLAKPEGPANVLELGSGTGIFTRCLLAHKTFGPVVAQLHAVEPSAGMRSRFDATISDARVSCRDGTFESTGAEDAWADIVVVAQAWHWCPDFDKSLIEFARVLKPDGIVALIWNMEDNSVPWVAKNRQIYERYEQGTPQYRLGLWRKMFDVPAINLYKSPHEEHEVKWVWPTTLERVIERVFTKSYIAVLPDDEKVKLNEELVKAVSHGEGREWIDKEKGTWEYPHTTHVVILRKK